MLNEKDLVTKYRETIYQETKWTKLVSLKYVQIE